MTRWAGLLCLASLNGALLAAFLPATAVADQVPVEFRGTWGQRCNDPVAPRIILEPDSITVMASGQRHTYAGVTASHTWVGGARASGKQVWLPISKEPNGPFAFVLEPPPYGKKGVMTLDEGHPDHGREVRNLWGSRFSRCQVDMGSPSEAKPAASGGGKWIATVKTQPVGVNLAATNGKVKLLGGCNKSGGPRFMGSLYGYPGNALNRTDDQEEPVIFAVAGKDGPASFPVNMAYYAPEKAWVMSDGLPVVFLDAFERGETLTIRNGKGRDVVTFGLRGAAAAAQTMRQGCGA